MQSAAIRKRFLEYFQRRGHTLVASSPVIPHDDPTLLFTNAGMNQFKELFLGHAAPPYPRAATSQKCIRAGGKHNDLDNVGHTSRHLTFFEMLGNFSFGDYFKEEAITFAWEVATQVFRFDAERIWPTVFREDDEAFEFWTRYVHPDRITRMDEKDNFWAMGETGPCGPCSELLFDRGSSFSNARSPREDSSGERFLEFWNLVFMQYNRTLEGQLEKLTHQSIDTGSGLERVVSLKMGVDSVFETDIFCRLIEATAQLSGVPYVSDEPRSASFRVIADHLRALSFAIADGAQPSNVERGYVLRKLLRRAVRYGKNLGFDAPFLGRLLPTLIECMGEDYPELSTHKGRIEEILYLEEESFWRTLRRGGRLLADICSQARKEQRPIRGEEAFNLKDTYGLPLEEIKLLAHDEGLGVDEERFAQLQEQARELSRTQHKKTHQLAQDNPYSELGLEAEFVGYDTLECFAKITAIMVDGQSRKSLEQGERGALVLDRTPFYAEKGGQVADEGELVTQDARFEVAQTLAPANGVIAQIGQVKEGRLQVGQQVKAQVTKARRMALQRSHTATHLLHWALTEVLGPQIQQKGSLVDTDTLRFDFSHHKPLTREQLQQLERLVNEKILLDDQVATYERSLSEVQQDPTIKQFFADKYGDSVRVVDIGYSKELCGGTHVRRTSQIGQLRLVRESSIASGVRRIEALVGQKALEACWSERHLLAELGEQMKAAPTQLLERVEANYRELEQLREEISRMRREAMVGRAKELIAQAQLVGSTPYIEATVEEPSQLQELSEQLKSFEGLALLCSSTLERVHLLIRSGKLAQANGFFASSLVQQLAPLVEGRGGGKPELAQAGGTRVEGLRNLQEQLKARLAHPCS